MRRGSIEPWLVRTAWARVARPPGSWWTITLLVVGLGACHEPIFGPDTPSARVVVRGTITSAADGSPVVGAEVFPAHLNFVHYSGRGIVVDTAVTDATGRYLLETAHWCPSQVAAEADGYLWTRTGPTLTCPGAGTVLEVDIALPPMVWAWADYEPAWSPDGAEIAVSSNRPDIRGVDIHLLDTLGIATRLTRGLGAASPTWSPDGLRIAFSSGQSVFIIDRDGSDLHEVATDHQIAGIAWAPDGEAIALWTLGGSVETHIHLLEIATSEVTPLTQPGSSNMQLSWSPDASKAVFASNRDGTWQIHRMEADGSGVTRLTDVPGGALEPAWSPSGTRIAFTARVGGRTVIQMMDSDGSNVATLTDEGDGNRSPSWSADSSRIVFTSNRDSRVDRAWDIWIINHDGSGLRKVTRRE